MGFAQSLEADAANVAQRLEALLDAHAKAGAPQRLTDAMRHAVLGGGKRFRPFLVLETARLFDAADTRALDVAAALECIHCYSLVHDDLPAMDNDELRRGRPTVWRAYDEWTAILAGDALLTLAFEVVADAELPPQAGVHLSRRLAQLAGGAGMVGGQCLDLEADKLGSGTTLTFEDVRRLQGMKTGALIRFACEAGGIIGNATPAEAEALAAYGDALGFVFQIADDLLDVEGDAAAMGKAVAKDAAAGKATLVSLMGVPAARARLDETVAGAIGALAPFGGRAAVLADAARFAAGRRS